MYEGEYAGWYWHCGRTACTMYMYMYTCMYSIRRESKLGKVSVRRDACTLFAAYNVKASRQK